MGCNFSALGSLCRVPGWSLAVPVKNPLIKLRMASILPLGSSTTECSPALSGTHAGSYTPSSHHLTAQFIGLQIQPSNCYFCSSLRRPQGQQVVSILKGVQSISRGEQELKIKKATSTFPSRKAPKGSLHISVCQSEETKAFCICTLPASSACHSFLCILMRASGCCEHIILQPLQ